jgi:glycosyltransferase involved in cell wall biosynthesis
MKITLATPLYPPDIGGPATDAATLREVLTTRGMDVAILPFSGVRHLPKVVRHIAYFGKLLGAARGASAIVAFDTVSVGLPAALAARVLRLPLIVRVPGDYAWEQGVQRFHVGDSIEIFQRKRYGLEVELLRSVQRFVAASAALVIVPSDYFKGIVSTWGVAPERLLRIYLGIAATGEAVMPDPRPSGRVLFSVGRFVPWKGFTLLFRLLAKRPEWRAVIAGDGPLRQALEAQARVLGVTDRVAFTGTLPRAEVLGWCGEADAFVLNTSFESFSFQVLEAMAAGAAIITTRAGSLPELITDGVEGVLCEPNDEDAFRTALESIEREPDLWKARRHAAKLKASRFTLAVSGDAFAEAIETICV